MSKKKHATPTQPAVRRSRARKTLKSSNDRVTLSVQNRARVKLIREGAFAAPHNCLIWKDPRETIFACRRILSFMSCIECPFDSQELDAAEADILHMVTDALKHVEDSLGNLFVAEPTASKEAQS